MKHLKISYLLYFLLLLLVSFKLYRNPEYNWDSLPYMAIVLSYEGETPQQIHRQVYEISENEIPSDKYSLIIDSTNLHRKRALQEVEFFSSLYPMYVVKPMYTRLCWLLYKAGISLPKTTYLVSTIAYILIGLVLLSWLGYYFKPIVSVILSTAIVLMSFMTETARLSTPDMLSALLLFTAMFFLIEKKKPGLAAIVFISAILARIDNVIPVFMILTGYKLFSRDQLSWKTYFLMLTGVAIIFLYVSSLANPFGFSWMYIDSYISNMKTADTTTQLHVNDSRFLLSQILMGLRHSSIALFALFGFIGLVARKHAPQLNWLIVTIAICMLTRFFLQPLISDRFFIPYYLLIIVIISAKLLAIISTKRTVNASN